MSEEMSASSSPLRTNGPRQHSDYGNSMVKDEDERERKPLGSLGINDYGLFYPQGEKRFSHAYDIGGKDFSGSFQGDLEMVRWMTSLRLILKQTKWRRHFSFTLRPRTRPPSPLEKGVLARTADRLFIDFDPSFSFSSLGKFSQSWCTCTRIR